MSSPRTVFSRHARLSEKEVLPYLRAWKHLVRVEHHAHAYDGTVEITEDTGQLRFSGVAKGKDRTTLVFDLANADFEQFEEPGDWEDAFIAFPQTSEWFILRKWPTR